MQIKIPKGTKDILPKEIGKWYAVENAIKEICAVFGYSEIRTPVFESTDLFRRGVGETTDIVQKEMYTFEDKGGRSLTLRPEGTAGVVRSYIENGMASYPSPVKLFYKITSYRYENVQKGRYREFNQFGVEALGCPFPAIDAEMISLADAFIRKIGIRNVELNINSIGCSKCRPVYNAALKDYLQKIKGDLCGLCLDRIEKNPLRVIDCKEEKCKIATADAPVMIDYLCDECTVHFESLKEKLNDLDIRYKIDPRIVRGLDYYSKTVFEFVSTSIGAQGTVCGGGRYDGLVEECGGLPTPGIGFAMGIERLLLQLDSEGVIFEETNPITAYVVSIGDAARRKAVELTLELRNSSVAAECDCMERSVKAQMKAADKAKAKYVVLIGDDELASNTVKVKNMSNGIEKTIDTSDLIREVTLNG